MKDAAATGVGGCEREEKQQQQRAPLLQPRSSALIEIDETELYSIRSKLKVVFEIDSDRTE